MKNYLLLCGGVGGAKLALGFSKILSDSNYTIAVNTGDDFNHFNHLNHLNHLSRGGILGSGQGWAGLTHFLPF